MKASIFLISFVALSCASTKKAPSGPSESVGEPIKAASPVCANGGERFTLLVHGGVGYTANAIQSEVVRQVLNEGYALLKAGYLSEDVVQRATEVFEDSGVFNAGKGGTRTSLKTVELDASIMEGKTLKAGGVASLKDIKNPIRLARAVKDQTKHVFMVADGASKFASQLNYEKVSPDYFTAVASHSALKQDSHYGTVGAVAFDRCGNLAAATSTGGLFGKLPGRVGDSPVIGAGTYANNQTVAVSATGSGEKFIRANVAGRISNIVQYTDRDARWATKEALAQVEKIDGTGGVIVLDRKGNPHWLTIKGHPMPGGYIRQDGQLYERDLTKR